MRYLRSYQYIFDNPKWVNNVLLAGLCVLSTQFIPVIGGIVLIGYLFEVIEGMHRRKDDRAYPDFTFDRLKDYLVRGLWPFLVAFIISLPLIVVVAVAYGVGALMTALLAEKAGAIIIVVFYLVVVLVTLVLGVAIGIVTIPVELRAGLMQDFAPAFSVDFIKDFFRRVWKEALLVQLFLIVSSVLLSMVGLLACCVGLYFTAALTYFARYHLWYQVYELYLQRGGTPIPLKTAAAPDASSPAGVPPGSFTAQAPESAPDATIVQGQGSPPPPGETGRPEPPTAPFRPEEPPPPSPFGSPEPPPR